MLMPRIRRRSVAFLERDGETWSCFLVTFRADDGRWRGHFSFRPRSGYLGDDEVRTADIFLEESESEIDEKARGLGRPLLNSLLVSALHMREQREDRTPRLRRWFREVLAENARELVDDRDGTDIAGRDDGTDVERLRSLYASYRLDQVAHLIALVEPDDFEEAVASLLDGREIDFRTRDQLQLAMMVVDQIETRLPLPPFELWLKDYLANRESYRLYAHTLHRSGGLP